MALEPKHSSRLSPAEGPKGTPRQGTSEARRDTAGSTHRSRAAKGNWSSSRGRTAGGLARSVGWVTQSRCRWSPCRVCRLSSSLQESGHTNSTVAVLSRELPEIGIPSGRRGGGRPGNSEGAVLIRVRRCAPREWAGREGTCRQTGPGVRSFLERGLITAAGARWSLRPCWAPKGAERRWTDRRGTSLGRCLGMEKVPTSAARSVSRGHDGSRGTIGRGMYRRCASEGHRVGAVNGPDTLG